MIFTYAANLATRPPVELVVYPTPGEQESSDGRALERLVSRIRLQWSEAARLAEASEPEMEYRAMPPRGSYRFRARIKMRGRGSPTRYELPDD